MHGLAPCDLGWDWGAMLASTGWWLEVAVVVVLCAVLAGLARWRGLLNSEGSVTAFAVGVLIGVFGGTIWIALLLVFLLTSFAATRYRFEAKRAMGLQEGRRGERGAANVVANGLVPCMIAVMHPWIGFPAEVLFLASVAAAASDTLASELGVLSQNAYLITTGKRVPPGTNGGVSAAGMWWAFFAAFYTSVVGWAVFWYIGSRHLTVLTFVVPIIFGFVGCQIDSVLGATLENRGYLTKLTNNLTSIALATVLAAVVLLV